MSKAEEKETAKETNELVVDSISPKNATNRNVVRSDEEVIYTNLQEILSENEDIAELVLRALVKRFPNATYQADEGFRINGKGNRSDGLITNESLPPIGRSTFVLLLQRYVKNFDFN